VASAANHGDVHCIVRLAAIFCHDVCSYCIVAAV
jgi:hypothetical protein